MEAASKPVVVVGYDGRDESRDALALARLLAPRIGAELLLVSVFTRAPLEIEALSYERALEEDAERFAASIREQVGDEPARTLALPAASAAFALHEVAERERAELIVLGSTHRGPLGRVLPGSVGERLLAAGPCAVAVAPRGYAERPATELRAVGVGWAATPEAERALDFAAGIAGGAGASLTLLSAVEPISHAALATPGGTGAWESLEYGFRVALDEALADRRRALDEALASLPADLDASGDVVSGEAAASLVELSGDLDLLVLGSRGYGPLRRVLLGSVSAPVMRRARCPVVVVPRADADD